MFKNHKYISCLLVAALFSAASCLDERFEQASGGGQSVAIKLAAPASPSTRSTEHENTIKTLDVLAFKVADGAETFLYRAEAARTDNAGQTFSATLRANNARQRFVLVANAGEQLTALAGERGENCVGMEKEAMLRNLLADNNGKLHPKTPVPMWAETLPMTVDEKTKSISDSPVKMLRMTAKIDVQLAPSLRGEYKLRNVFLYNRNTSGRIAPEERNVEYSNGGAKAVKPSLPQRLETLRGPIEYADCSVAEAEMKNAIYLFETAADNTDFLNETCIVVGVENESAELGYYRLDFISGEDSLHLDILRNHLYFCNITAINGPGLPTPDKAFKTRQYHMQADVFPWEDGMGGSDILFDQQYFLTVSRSLFEFDANGRAIDGDNLLKIETNLPSNWSYSVWKDREGATPLPSNWLHASIESKTDLRLAPVANDDGAPRTAYIHIKAGRLIYPVEVRQEKIGAGQAIIFVDPANVVLPYAIEDYKNHKVTIFCRDYAGKDAPTQQWTLTTKDPWLRLQTEKDGPGRSVSGFGTTTVYLVPETNLDDLRETAIYLGDSEQDVKVAVTQQGKEDVKIDVDFPGAGELPVLPDGHASYVGAFWRWSETGERLVRIRLGENSAYYGAWTATVAWYDSKWNPAGGDGIILSAEASPDNKIYTNTPGNAEAHQLTGNATTVSGTVDASNKEAFFRIGLTRKFTAYNADNNPARYAVIVLSYADNSRKQKIFIRQGEGADYLMTKTDPMSGFALSPNRPEARRFAPYNNAGGAALNAAVPAHNGFFANFPTQAGAFWSYGNNKRVAYAPHSAKTGEAHPTEGFWNKISAKNETSPAGFRRPNDGPIDKASDGATAAKSEMRQSLFVLPPLKQGASHGKVDNSAWGYYADGFFDRRPVVDAVGKKHDKNSGKNSAVSVATRDVAYVGRLFFNPLPESGHYNASLFFPAAGVRDEDGNLCYAGQQGNYMSATKNGSCEHDSSYNLMTERSNAYFNHYPKSGSDIDDRTLMTVRAIRNE